MGIGIPGGGGGFRRGGGGDYFDRLFEQRGTRPRTGTRQRINAGPLPRFSIVNKDQGLQILAGGISQACREAALSLCFSQQSTYMTFRTVSAHPTYGDIFVQYQESFGIVANANSLNFDHITFNRGISQADVLHILNAIPKATIPQDLRRLDAYGAGAVAFADQVQTTPKVDPRLAQIATSTDLKWLEAQGQKALQQNQTAIFMATLHRRLELDPSNSRLRRTLVTNLLQQKTIGPEDTETILALIKKISEEQNSQNWLADKYKEARAVAAVPDAVKALLEELTRDARAQKPNEPVVHDFVGSRHVELDHRGVSPLDWPDLTSFGRPPRKDR